MDFIFKCGCVGGNTTNLKKKKWEEGRYKGLELELNLYVVPDTRYKVSGEESKWQVNC